MGTLFEKTKKQNQIQFIPDKQLMVLWMILLAVEVNLLPVILKSTFIILLKVPVHSALTLIWEPLLPLMQFVIGDKLLHFIETLHACSFS